MHAKQNETLVKRLPYFGTRTAFIVQPEQMHATIIPDVAIGSSYCNAMSKCGDLADWTLHTALRIGVNGIPDDAPHREDGSRRRMTVIFVCIQYHPQLNKPWYTVILPWYA